MCPERPGVEGRVDPSTTRAHKDLLRIQGLTVDEINQLVDAAAAFKEVGWRRRKPSVFRAQYHTEISAELHDVDDQLGGYSTIIVDN